MLNGEQHVWKLSHYSPPPRVITAILFVSSSTFAGPADARCWSIHKSPNWAEVQAPLGKAKLREILPEGPNRTDKLSISVFDICDAPGGIRLHVEASLKCSAGHNMFWEQPRKAAALIEAFLSQ